MKRITNSDVVVLGAGMTGLAVGCAAGFPIYEAASDPGGICSSYYMRPGTSKRLPSAPRDGDAYRFEIGGGHWIFGADELVLEFIRSLTEVRRYSRKSSVYFPATRALVPYPLQNNLRFLGSDIAQKALCEMAAAAAETRTVVTLADWLEVSFGRTLCELFFDPFHELYTAGLCRSIAPQDAYKSPVDLSSAIRGAFGDTTPIGYNTTFIYPTGGLNRLAQEMASRCDIHYGKRVVRIDPKRSDVYFADDSVVNYGRLISTLPLNRTMNFAGLEVASSPDPSPSVLVLNIGAKKGPACPEDHWLYVPQSKSAFHRVGFYSNVDSSFLPVSAQAAQNRVSIYVEKAYAEGQKPTPAEMEKLGKAVVEELREWGWITAAEVVDPTWIDVAYTWTRPGSNWKRQAIKSLEDRGIFPVGRYARWNFQGIADSIRDGLFAGAALTAHRVKSSEETREAVAD